jgi:hypothetical protein
MPEKSKTVLFAREKDTKNTVKFAEVQTQGQAPIVGTLYVQKCYTASGFMPHGLRLAPVLQG